MTHTKKNNIPIQFELALIFYVLHNTIPVVGFHTPAVVNALVLAYLYIFLFIHSKNFILDFGHVIPIFSITILSILYGGFKDFATDIYFIAQTFIYPLVTLYLFKCQNQKAVTRIFYIVIISYMVTAVTTYIGCGIFPGASRQIAGNLDSKDEELFTLYMQYNIGSFAFIYTLVMLLPIAIGMFRTHKKSILFSVTMMVLIVMTVIRSEYSTALIMMVLIAVSFFFPTNFRFRHIFYLFIVCGIFYIVGKLSLGQLLIDLSQKVESASVSERFYDLGTFFVSNGGAANMEGDVGYRMEFYQKSLDMFKAYPILGGGVQAAGGHSFLFDNLGKFGIIGLFATILVYSKIYILFYRPFRFNSWYGYALIVFVVALILATLNPKDNIGVLTFTIPLFMKAFDTTKR